jgi:hypothetical protein
MIRLGCSSRSQIYADQRMLRKLISRENPAHGLRSDGAAGNSEWGENALWKIALRQIADVPSRLRKV